MVEKRRTSFMDVPLPHPYLTFSSMYYVVCVYKQKFTSIPLMSHYCLLAFRSDLPIAFLFWKTYKFKTHKVSFNFATNFRVRRACGHGDEGTCSH